MKVIKIEFVQQEPSLVGDDIGRETFTEQVLPNVDIENMEEITVQFPEYVSLITSSFVQGFSNAIVKRYNRDGFKKFVHIKAATKKIETDFYEDL